MATRSLESNVLDASVVELHVERHAIAAQRVDAFDDAIGILDLTEISRLAVVIENHLAIEIGEIAHENSSTARFNAATSRSTSSRLL